MLRSTLVTLLWVAAASAADLKPVAEGPEGKRAFDDLARFYADDQKVPPFAEAMRDLKAADAGKRRAAGAYLLALFRQSFADEDNGRSPWQRLPYFGGGSRSAARDLRSKLAEAFGKEAAGEEAIDAALWLLNTERLPDGQRAGILALRRLKGANADKAITGVLVPPHPCEEVLVGAVEEAGARGLNGNAVLALGNHHRAAVREAARKVVEKHKIGAVPAFKSEDAFIPTLTKALDTIAEMIEEAPRDTRWVDVTFVGGEGKKTVRMTGWLLENGDDYRVLDWFGDEERIPARTFTVERKSLAEAAARFKAIREKGDREALGELSRRGMLTMQFQPRAVTEPELRIAAWGWKRGEKKVCADVLFPRIDELADDRFLVEIARDLIGHSLHQRMLELFSHERDYDGALRLARRLAKPAFDGYKYQPRARTLAVQLARRGDDFKRVKLPDHGQWKALQGKMKREEKIKYLADRLRLLNCIQMSQPGGIDYDQPQYRLPMGKSGESKVEVINPYTELEKMKLTVADLVTLAPHLADENYMLAFSYWRDFHPDRTLHMVNWAVADLVNAAAKRDLADLATYFRLDPAGKQAHLEKVIGWCKVNAGKSEEELLLDVVTTAPSREEFYSAAQELIAAKKTRVLPPLLKRMKDHRDEARIIAELCHRLDAPETASPAREWVKGDDQTVAFWGSLILLRHGEKTKKEGLEPLRKILEKDDGEILYPRALDTLLATKDPAALDLAAGILGKHHFGTRPNRAAVLHRLFLAGRPEALDYLLAGLDSKDEGGTSFGKYKGQEVQRKLTRGDEFAGDVSEWRTEGPGYERMAPDEDRAKQREALKGWLKEQFALIKAGKKPMMSTQPRPITTPQWRLDAP